MARRRDVGVHEGRQAAARQRLDAHRSAPGEEVEDRRLLHHAEAAEGVEGGLPDPIGRGPGGGARRSHELAAPPPTRRSHASAARYPDLYGPHMTTPGPPDGVVVVRIDQGTSATP